MLPPEDEDDGYNEDVAFDVDDYYYSADDPWWSGARSDW